MTASNPPLFLQAETYSAAHDRFAMESSLTMPPALLDGSTTYGVEGGIIPADGGNSNPTTPLRVTVSSGLTLSVSAGTAVISADNVNANLPGVYIGRNAGTASITLPARDTLDRLDLVYAGIKDTADGGASDEFVIDFVEGTPASNPSPPSVVPGITRWIPLAFVFVKNSGAGGVAIPTDSTGVRDRRQYATGRGGVRLYGDSLTTPPGIQGTIRYNIDTGDMHLYKAVGSGGTGWRKIYTKEEYDERSQADNLQARPAQVVHNAKKRSKSTSWESTPQLDSNGTSISAADVTTDAWQTPSGRVFINISAITDLESNSSNGRLGFSIIRQSNNNTVESPSVDQCILFSTVDRRSQSWTGIISGLNQNEDYKARMMFSNNNGNAWAYFESCRLTAWPIR